MREIAHGRKSDVSNRL